MPLTEPEIDQLQPASRPFKRSDGGGLCLLLMPAGGKWWRYNYRFGSLSKTLALGAYPEVSLSEARARRDEAKELLEDGIDPSVVRREEKARETAARLAAASNAAFRVSIAADGSTEIWKGRSVVNITAEETRVLHTLLTKLLA